MNAESLRSEREIVVQNVHDLLGNKLEQVPEMQRVVVEIPKAFGYLATYLAYRDKSDNRGGWLEVSELIEGNRGLARHYARLRNAYIEGLLTDSFHRLLHELVSEGTPDLEKGRAFRTQK